MKKGVMALDFADPEKEVRRLFKNNPKGEIVFEEFVEWMVKLGN